ncbi:hypothetical protein JTB14_009280 [Gonioctena quinquepunctata]|nr:hypothetical protein JTB14_009280 [Gonioctena quinquepunctata]
MKVFVGLLVLVAVVSYCQAGLIGGWNGGGGWSSRYGSGRGWSSGYGGGYGGGWRSGGWNGGYGGVKVVKVVYPVAAGGVDGIRDMVVDRNGVVMEAVGKADTGVGGVQVGGERSHGDFDHSNGANPMYFEAELYSDHKRNVI